KVCGAAAAACAAAGGPLPGAPPPTRARPAFRRPRDLRDHPLDLAHDRVRDALAAVLRGKDVPGVGFDLEVLTHRLASDDREELAHISLRRKEAAEPLAEERDVKVDA